jgi:phosphoribosylformylglycinamidine synthase
VVAVQRAVRDAVRGGALSSCHDLAEGGLLVALAECCLAGGMGAAVDLGPSTDPWTALFGEGPGGFLVSGPREALEALDPRLGARVIGSTGGDTLAVAIAAGPVTCSLAELRAAHAALGALFP